MRIFVLSLLLCGVIQGMVAAEGLRGMRTVTAFGALGDGAHDDTAAFQEALDAVAAEGGGVVQVPTGSYKITDTLDIPENVTLEGVWRGPARGTPFGEGGSVLLAYPGKGELDGPPLLRMHTSSTLKGLTIYYPEQIRANPPIPYPWTVQAAPPSTDNIGIFDVTMVNPYQAVDLGTYPAGRHTVNNLHAYALFRGIYINQCYDVGRIENVHFWPFWDLDPNSPLWEFTKAHAESFIIGKTDGQIGHNLFSIFYSVGMRFIDGPIYNADREIVDYQPGSGMYSNCYIDVTPLAVQVDSAMPSAGVSFVNSSIMSRVVVGPRNRGPVKFTGSGFWAVPELGSHVETAGRGTVFLNGCHFSNWDRENLGVPCIDANNRRILITGNDFDTLRPDHHILRLGPRVRSAIVTSNFMPVGKNITDETLETADVHIAFNAVQPPSNYLTEWLVLGPFPNPDLEEASDSGATRAGHDRDYLEGLGGEAQARLERGATVGLELPDGSSETFRARPLNANRGNFVAFDLYYQVPNHVAYAFAYIVSEREQTAYFEGCMNDGGKVWVNGEQVYERFSPHGQQCAPGSDMFEARLRPGLNAILLKIEDAGGRRWEFQLEAYGEDGQPLESTLTGSEAP